MSTSMTLFEIGHGLISLYESIDDTGEIDTSTEQLLTFLANAEGEKLDSYIGLYRQLNAEEAAAKEEMERWKQRQESRLKSIKKLKAALLQHMETTKQKKIVTKKGRVIALRKNGGLQPIEIDDGVDPTQLPKELTITKTFPLMDEIRKVLELGVDIAGVRLGERGSHVRID